MNFSFPSREFDDAVAAVCHGAATDEQLRALNALLRGHPAARDEYILRLELHSRLASEPDLFVTANDDLSELKAPACGAIPPANISSLQPRRRVRDRKSSWAVGLAAAGLLIAAGWWGLKDWRFGERMGMTSKAVAMLNRVVDARWGFERGNSAWGAPLEPGWLRLKSGLAQVVFYSGARVVIEGPTEFEVISAREASCLHGRLTAEVPEQARGFRIGTPRMDVTDLGTVFGLEVKERRTELHVFKGSVRFETEGGADEQTLPEGTAAVVERAAAPRLIAANRAGFESLFGLLAKSAAAETLRYDEWRAASDRLKRDPSLLVYLDFEKGSSSDWRLRNEGNGRAAVPGASLVGCQWTAGRWPDKRALEFQSVNDRVRLSVPGEFEALTLAVWARVHGLDRRINSLFMSDGFEPGTVHWLIRNDGVLGLTVIGRRSGHYQIVASPPVLTVEQFGMWLHLAVVIDGRNGRALFYLNGRPVGGKPLRIAPPYFIDEAELGNWNARGFSGEDPFLIRNFSGAMDEFCLFNRALDEREIRGLYADGKPHPDRMAKR